MRLSPSLAAVPFPPIAQVRQWLTRYNGEFGPSINLCQGAPSTPPCKQLEDALAKATADPLSAKYSTNFGLQPLREALAQEMRDFYGPDTDVEHTDVALTAGCNLAFYAAAQVVADRGDEVILPVPWYFNHQMSLQMLGITCDPLLLKVEKGFQPSVEDCEALITSKTRAIALVTPNNPTGAVYSPALIKSFALLAQKHDIALIIDETYRDFITTGPPHSLFSKSEDWDWRNTFIHLFSFSKSYAIAGHRLGAIVAGQAVLKQLPTVLDTIQISPPTLAQLALQPILPSLRPLLNDTARAVSTRHDHFRHVMTTAPRWHIGSQGGYFAFIRHPFEDKSTEEVCEGLATRVGVACLAGSYFAADHKDSIAKGGKEFARKWMRFAVANVEEEDLTEVAKRLVVFEEVSGWKIG